MSGTKNDGIGYIVLAVFVILLGLGIAVFKAWVWIHFIIKFW
jgi:hypothetical protein